MRHYNRGLCCCSILGLLLLLACSESRPFGTNSASPHPHHESFYPQTATTTQLPQQTRQRRRTLLDALAQLLRRVRLRGERSNKNSYNELSEHETATDDTATRSQLQEQPLASPPSSLQYQGSLGSSMMRQLHQSLHVQLPPPGRMLSLAASGAQIGILCWLGSMIWKAVVEVVEEYSQEINSEDPLLCSKKEQLEQLVSFLHQTPAQQQQQMKQKKSDSLPPLPLLQIAHKLALSGLPLTSASAAGQQQKPSVQSVLSRITKNQANLLQQCLRTPPPTAESPGLPKSSSASPWDHVVGLDAIKERLQSAIALSTDSHADDSNTNNSQHHHHHHQQHAFGPLFDHSAMTGILLYGPPGCGKTQLVKALASAAQLPCLVVAPSVLLRKYVGETNAQVKALFGLAQILAPCIVCIDELDGLFRERRDDEHEVSRDLKTEFLQWWDGLLNTSPATSASQQQNTSGDGTTVTPLTTNSNSNNKRIIIIGATNRPFDVDAAVLRRLPQSHFVGLPDALARAALLKQLLAAIPNTCIADPDGMNDIVAQTERYTPSDIKQVLQTAALMGPMRERIARPLTVADLRRALQTTPPTPLSMSYRQALAAFCQQQLQHGNMQAELSDRMQHNAPADTFMMQQKWETDAGNFYNVGSIHVDHETFDALTALVNLLESMSDTERDSSDHDYTDFDDDDDASMDD